MKHLQVTRGGLGSRLLERALGNYPDSLVEISFGCQGRDVPDKDFQVSPWWLAGWLVAFCLHLPRVPSFP